MNGIFKYVCECLNFKDWKVTISIILIIFESKLKMTVSQKSFLENDILFGGGNSIEIFL